jgi:hypothetical protein
VISAATSPSHAIPDASVAARPAQIRYAAEPPGATMGCTASADLCHTGSPTRTQNVAAPATRMVAAKWMARTAASGSVKVDSRLFAARAQLAPHLPTVKLKAPSVVCVSTDKTRQLTR